METTNAHPIVRTIQRRWPAVQPWLGTAARVVVALVFIAAGALKVGDLAESGRSVNAYQVMPIELGRFVGATLPFVEIVLGVMLLIGFTTRLTSLALAGLLVVFITGISQAWARGLSIDCGCFGGGGEIAADVARRKYVLEIARDILLFAAAAFVVVFPRTKYSLDDRLAGPEENH